MFHLYKTFVSSNRENKNCSFIYIYIHIRSIMILNRTINEIVYNKLLKLYISLKSINGRYCSSIEGPFGKITFCYFQVR